MSRRQATGWVILICDWEGCDHQNPASRKLDPEQREEAILERRRWLYFFSSDGLLLDFCPDHGERVRQMVAQVARREA